MLRYKIAKTNKDYQAAAELFREYAAWLTIDICFQHFDKELLVLETMYGPGNGGIILCEKEGYPIACVGVRRLNNTEAEMKRMWLKRGNEGLGIGKQLLQKAIGLAKSCGYKKIKLDTLNDMVPAMNLYRSHGFREIPPYYHNPYKRAVYFEKTL